jgi:hypothetical protein
MRQKLFVVASGEFVKNECPERIGVIGYQA